MYKTAISFKDLWNRQLSLYRAPSAVQQSHSRVNRPLLQAIVGEGDPQILAVEGERELAFVHVQEDAEHTFFLHSFPVLRARSVGVMP